MEESRREADDGGAAAGAAAGASAADETGAGGRQQEQAQQQQQQQQRAKAKKRTGTSKYDFVKVRVRLDTPLPPPLKAQPPADGQGRDGGTRATPPPPPPPADPTKPQTPTTATATTSSYVLSRYLVARMLAVARVPYVKAVKCALELKKRLVDAGVAELSQRDLEQRLFALLREKGFGADVHRAYTLAASFYGARVPLVVALVGAPWTGKTALAQQLAARLNAPNVVATDAVRSALGSAAWASAAAAAATAAAAAAGAAGAAAAAAGAAAGAAGAAGAAAAAGAADDRGGLGAGGGGAGGPRAAAAAAAAASAAALAAACAGAAAGLAPVPLWARADLAPPSSLSGSGDDNSDATACQRRLLDAWRGECRAVRRALAGDLSRALSDGRPLLLEGAALDPGTLAADLGRAGMAVMLPAAKQRPHVRGGADGQDRAGAAGGGAGEAAAAVGAAAASAAAPSAPAAAAPSAAAPASAGPRPRPIFIPVIIAMDEPEHRLMAEDALARQPHLRLDAAPTPKGFGEDGKGERNGEQDDGAAPAAAAAAPAAAEAAFWRARALQAHLASYGDQGLPVLRVRYGAFTEAVDALHDYALRCIQLSMQGV